MSLPVSCVTPHFPNWKRALRGWHRLSGDRAPGGIPHIVATHHGMTQKPVLPTAQHSPEAWAVLRDSHKVCSSLSLPSWHLRRGSAKPQGQTQTSACPPRCAPTRNEHRRLVTAAQPTAAPGVHRHRADAVARATRNTPQQQKSTNGLCTPQHS